MLDEGDRLKLTCTVKGRPDPEVEWFYNGQVSSLPISLFVNIYIYNVL